MKRAFTLIEVNLAIMVMAVGVLGIISLYALGYREERQSREDVASAAYADAVMAPLVTALTATNVKWSVFRRLDDAPGSVRIKTQPCKGWGHYIQNRSTGKIVANPESLAQAAYAKTIGALSLSSFPSAWPVNRSRAGDLQAALVIMHDEDSAVVRISFRAVDRENQLFSAPLYYTEARFQGVMDE